MTLPKDSRHEAWKKWSKETKDTILDLHESGMFIKDIAVRLDLQSHAIGWFLTLQGIDTEGRNKQPDFMPTPEEIRVECIAIRRAKGEPIPGELI